MPPKYLFFKLQDPAAYRLNSTLEYRRDLVKRQITLCKDNINTLYTPTEDRPRSGRKYLRTN